MGCYGIGEAPNGCLWLCDPCSLALDRPPACALCPGEGRRRTGEGRALPPSEGSHLLLEEAARDAPVDRRPLMPSPPFPAPAAVLGGALKRSTCGRWAHPTCAHWLPQPVFDPGLAHHGLTGLIRDLDKVLPGVLQWGRGTVGTAAYIFVFPSARV